MHKKSIILNRRAEIKSAALQLRRDTELALSDTCMKMVTNELKYLEQRVLLSDKAYEEKLFREDEKVLFNLRMLELKLFLNVASLLTMENKNQIHYLKMLKQIK